MAVPFSTAVKESVPRVDGQVAVGEDLDFQRRWWRFEKALWIAFCLVLICDLLGLFGEGYLSKTVRATPDRALSLQYQRMMRFGTPSTLLLRFGPAAVRDGRMSVFVSDSVLKQLGAERVVPQPQQSILGDDGVTYTFPANSPPWNMQIQLSPRSPGLQTFRIQVAGASPLEARSFVFP